MTAKHACPTCDLVHWPRSHQWDRAISGALVGFLLALLLVGLFVSKGCAQRAHDAPDFHYGTNAVERMYYCSMAHGGAHLPSDQDECERW